MPLSNHLAPVRLDWSGMTFTGLGSGSGILFDEVTLEARIGPEVVALLIDPEPDELLTKPELDLNLKAGIAQTPYGPIMFLIWWVPPIVNGRPLVFYEQVMSPLYPETSTILGRLSGQTHLHVLVVGSGGRVCNLFEYRNIFGFEKILTGAVAARVAWPGTDDFKRAKQSYEQEYSVDGLLAEESD
jgi:hypothetical protein